MKKLILAEKPSLGKKIAKALGVNNRNSNGHFENNDIIVASLVGHVIEAKYPKIPWTVDNLPLSLENPPMIPSSGKNELVKKLKKEVMRSDISEIVNAGDADTEGSLLVYELYEYFNILNSDKKFSRMWILAEDERTIKKAFNDRYSQEKDMKFVNAGKSRSLADVRLGFNFSRLYTLKNNVYGESFAIGRVMTPTMQIVRERELEIERFNPEDYWTIKGEFNKEATNFLGDLFYITEEGKQSTSLNKQLFEEYKNKINNGDAYMVDAKTIKQNNKKPDFLPNLNDILKSMSKFHKMNSKKTTSIMQDLYESQFCTYPRSEVKFLPSSMEQEVREVYDHFVKLDANKIGNVIQFNIKNKRVFDDSKVGSHFAIIPMVKTELQISKLDVDHRKVLDYITSKFMMAFMGDYKYESTVIILKKDNTTFKISGKIEKNKGFKDFNCISNHSKSEDVIVPEIEKGDEVILNKIETKKNKTKPPAVITELTLLEIMENVHKLYKKQKNDEEGDLEHDGAFSLGTPATRGGIIEKLLKLKYLKKSGQKFVVTEFGIKLLNTAQGSLNIETTATFEEDMANIINEKEDSKEFDIKMAKYVNGIVSGEVVDIKKYIQNKQEHMKTGLSCPICSADIRQNEKVYRCSDAGTWDPKKKTFSGCQFSVIKYVKPLNYTITLGDLGSLLNKKTIKVDNKTIVYDEKSKFFIKMQLPKTGENCPDCGADITENDKVYRCSDAGTWDPKSKKFSGCQFSVIKYVKPLDYSITKADLSKLLKGEIIKVNEKTLEFDPKSNFYVKIVMPKADLECPLCKADCIDTGRGYRCSKVGTWDPKNKAFSGCRFNVMKHIKPLKWDMSKQDLEKMIDGDTIDVDGKKVYFDPESKFFIKIIF